MTIDWIAKLRHLLQTIAFSLGVSAIHLGFMPERPYQGPLVYSLSIGLITWAVIDFGRHLLPSSVETGWPRGWPGVALVVGGILAGYLLGTAIGDTLCRWNSWAPPARSGMPVRTSLLITTLAGIAGTYYIYSRNQSAYLSRKMREANQLATETRLKLLEAQLEPHMLFNTLANLRVLIGLDTTRAQAMLDRLIGFLRATLDASRSGSHSLASEFARIGDYLELMRIRMGERLDARLELPPELADQPVPPLLLQPLVENAIKHGLEPHVSGGRLIVSALREGHMLVLRVRDTGIGLPASPLASGGFGLQQVRERLAALHGAPASIQVQPAGDALGGTLATLRMPMQP